MARNRIAQTLGRMTPRRSTLRLVKARRAQGRGIALAVFVVLKRLRVPANSCVGTFRRYSAITLLASSCRPRWTSAAAYHVDIPGSRSVSLSAASADS